MTKKTTKQSDEHQFIEPTPPIMGAVLHAMSSGQVTDWGITAINAPLAWRFGRGGGIRVAVLDTGISPHVDLPPIPPIAVSDRTKIGDLTIDVDTQSGLDTHGHGTHCLGIVGARDNGVGVVGVAPTSILQSIKVLRQNGGGSFHDIAVGVWIAHRMGADIISMSLGSSAKPPNDELQEVIEAAVNDGIVIVAAAGNECSPDGRDTVNYPAKLKGVIPVAAIDQNFAHAPFSSTGPELQRGIAMPGVNIYSTYPVNAYARLSGTSMATPMLAGFIALLLSYHENGQSHKTPIPPKGTRERVDAVLEHLGRYVRQLGDGETYGIGVIDGAKLTPDD